MNWKRIKDSQVSLYPHSKVEWYNELGAVDSVKIKENTMKYNYLVYANDWGSDYFESLDEAMKFAKKRVHKSQEDVQIFTKSHVVKFPLPEMDVEEVKLLEAS